MKKRIAINPIYTVMDITAALAISFHNAATD